MSFDMNLISKNLSNVQASAKSQDGGAGNTGYFMRGQQEENVGLKFKDSGTDFFDKSEQIDEEEKEESLLDLFLKLVEELIAKIKANEQAMVLDRPDDVAKLIGRNYNTGKEFSCWAHCWSYLYNFSSSLYMTYLLAKEQQGDLLQQAESIFGFLVLFF